MGRKVGTKASRAAYLAAAPSKRGRGRAAARQTAAENKRAIEAGETYRSQAPSQYRRKVRRK